eukprot:1051660-Rhodomonas_salina.1
MPLRSSGQASPEEVPDADSAMDAARGTALPDQGTVSFRGGFVQALRTCYRVRNEGRKRGRDAEFG